MKKWILFIGGGLLAVVACIYLLIPRRLPIGKVAYVPAGQSVVYRCLTEGSLIRAWWGAGAPGPAESTNPAYRQGATAFRFTGGMLNTVGTQVEGEGLGLKGVIRIVALQKDTSALEWKMELETTANPFTRVARYLAAREIKDKMTAVLDRLQRFAADEKKVYGLEIRHEKVTDTLLVTTRMESSRYPQPYQYDALIRQLRDYAAEGGARQTDFPMLNVLQLDSNRFETRVALPVNKRLPDRAGIRTKRMVPGNILVAEVTGGVQRIQTGFRQVQTYIADKELSMPAIAFQLLVTDRVQEPDSARWVTRLCFPVY